jgi:hypothetical protein
MSNALDHAGCSQTQGRRATRTDDNETFAEVSAQMRTSALLRVFKAIAPDEKKVVHIAREEFNAVVHGETSQPQTGQRNVAPAPVPRWERALTNSMPSVTSADYRKSARGRIEAIAVSHSSTLSRCVFWLKQKNDRV